MWTDELRREEQRLIRTRKEFHSTNVKQQIEYLRDFLINEVAISF